MTPRRPGAWLAGAPPAALATLTDGARATAETALSAAAP
jgi:hypothetical protein